MVSGAQLTCVLSRSKNRTEVKRQTRNRPGNTDSATLQFRSLHYEIDEERKVRSGEDEKSSGRQGVSAKN